MGGLNNHGQLGDGTVTQRLGYVEVMDDGVKDVCTGEYTTFVIKKDGSLWATGLNNYGQLGDGTVTTAGYSSLALKQDGSLWAAGYNNYGQLGDKTIVDKHTWVKVVEEGVKEVSNGDSHSVFLNDKNELCFTGYNGNGQLGTGDTTQVKGFGLKCYPRPGKP